MSSVGAMFSRRAAASEGSHAREESKARLRRLKEKLIKEGTLPEGTPRKEATTTVDVLAEISANELPLGRLAAHEQEPTRQDITACAPALLEYVTLSPC